MLAPSNSRYCTISWQQTLQNSPWDHAVSPSPALACFWSLQQAFEVGRHTYDHPALKWNKPCILFGKQKSVLSTTSSWANVFSIEAFEMMCWGRFDLVFFALDRCINHATTQWPAGSLLFNLFCNSLPAHKLSLKKKNTQILSYFKTISSWLFPVD